MNNVLKIYRIMLKHYWFLIFGFFCMFFYAVFSGASITMAIPFFDYVFDPGKDVIDYYAFGSFWEAVSSTTQNFFTHQEQSTLLYRIFGRASDLPVLLSEYKDIMARTDSFLLLKLICIAMFFIILFKNTFYYLNRLMFTNLRGRTIEDVRNMIFDKYLNQSYRFFTMNKPGDSLVRMVSDVQIVSDLFIYSLFNALRDLILILVYVRIAIFLNPRLFLISMVILPVCSILMNLLGRKIKKYARRIQSQFSDMYSNVEEVLNSMKIVKAFSKEKFENEKFKKINSRFFKLWRKSEIYLGMNVPISEMNGVLTGIIVLLIGGTEVLSGTGDFTLGDFSAFLFAMFSILHPLKTITKAYADIKKAMVSLDRISEVVNEKNDIIECQNPIPKSGFNSDIKLKNVSFEYLPEMKVLKNISLKISKGEQVALVGRSGSGKTTLINLLMRMYDVSQGEILIDDIPITKLKIADLRKLFGMVTQESILFTETVANNIAYGFKEAHHHEKIRKAAQIAYADEFIRNFPDGYNEILHGKGAGISGGQRQRICIARAIVDDPPILIFDEATSSLDTESEHFVQLAINQATKDRTVIVIAHRLSTVLKADKIIVMDNGEVVGCGKHIELLDKCNLYRQLYNIQFKN